MSQEDLPGGRNFYDPARNYPISHAPEEHNKLVLARRRFEGPHAFLADPVCAAVEAGQPRISQPKETTRFLRGETARVPDGHGIWLWTLGATEAHLGITKTAAPQMAFIEVLQDEAYTAARPDSAAAVAAMAWLPE
ncbi:hypothetical protein [Pararhodobacter zhoushanensis]|uniref:hypothetical protein n=1 Tax=Pararhodobacter zhoushanensis TaxID=2479545 RepID=UPI0013DE9F74|nr:hypothetical protein [Pararhodobacter zhoushanensis]